MILGAVLPSALLAGVIVQRTLAHTRVMLENRLVDTARVAAEALDREFDAPSAPPCSTRSRRSTALRAL